VSNGQIDFQDVLQLIELIRSSSNFSEIRLRSGDVEVELRRNGGAALAAAAETARPVSQSAPAVSTAATNTAAPPPIAAPAPAARVAASPSAATHAGAAIVKAPMVGTVYRASEPGAAPFVTIGQSVAPGDPLCIIEVMKLMNSISAECSGVVSDILVDDGQAVQYGQELFVISTR
jgi:acetyl-CoA carboxylase biotin carboxyl carrier protein